MLKSLLAIVPLLVSLIPLDAQAKRAEEGDVVKIQYTGKLADGRVFDSSVGKSDLEFILGENTMLPDLESAIFGMKPKELKTVTIPAARAYGSFDEAKIFKVPSAQIPESVKLGDSLSMRTTKGISNGRLIAIDGDDAYVDLNNFLVDQDLIFDIEVLKVTKPEN